MAAYATTTRQQTLAVVDTIPVGVIPYNQSAVNGWTGVRSDCSGLLWRLWGNGYTPGDGMWLGAPSTESMWRLGIIVPIPWAQLQPGDAIGYCGPGTANGGGGHIALWLGGDRRSRGAYEITDHGSGLGRKVRTVKWDGRSKGWLHPDKLAAWRYVNMREGDDVSRLIRQHDQKPVWWVAGNIRTWVRSEDHLRVLAARAGDLGIADGGRVLVVPDIEPFGVPYGPLPDGGWAGGGGPVGGVAQAVAEVLETARIVLPAAEK